MAHIYFTRWGMILREIDLPGYHTAGRLARGASYPGEIDSLGYISYPGEIDSQVYYNPVVSEFLIKIENILTLWSVAQVGSNYEKNAGRKSRWTVPLN